MKSLVHNEEAKGNIRTIRSTSWNTLLLLSAHLGLDKNPDLSSTGHLALAAILTRMSVKFLKLIILCPMILPSIFICLKNRRVHGP